MGFSEKQIQLLEAAEQLFADKGYAGTSVRDIGEAADMNVAMISYYFGSKEKLVEALFEYRSWHVQNRLEPLLKDPDLSPLEKLDLLIDEYVEKFWRNRRLHRTILREYNFRENKQLYKLIYSARKKQVRVMERLVEQGQEQGIFRKDADVPMLFALLSGMTKHTLIARDFFKDICRFKGTSDSQDRELIERMKTHLKFVLTHCLNEANAS